MRSLDVIVKVRCGSIATESSRQQVRLCPLYCALRRRAVLLVRTPRHYHQVGIRQGPAPEPRKV
jgi:hypothetical protein